jgi:hypothetical protein
MRTRWDRRLAVCLVVSLSACTLSPSDGADVGSMYNEVTMSGFARHAGASLLLEAYNHSTRQFDSIGTAVADTVPSVWGGRRMYPWVATPRVAVPGNSATRCRWTPACNTVAPLETRLRVRESYPTGERIPLPGLTASGWSCLYPQVSGQQDPVVVYVQCMGNPLLEIRVRAN